MNSVDHGIAEHVAAELINTSQDKSHHKRASEAAYGLAVLSINGVIGDGKWETRRDAGLKWLETAARSGSDRAQASFCRACRAFAVDIPADCVDMEQDWLQRTASKGFFVAMKDLEEFGFADALRDATETLRGRYGGTGAERYDSDLFPDDFPRAFDQRLSKQVQNVRQLGDSSRMNRFGDNILHFAVSCGLELTAEKLIENLDRDALNTTNVNGETPLLLACRSGHYATTMMLLEAGADPKMANDYGDTPLHWLLSFDDRYVDEVAQKLVQIGSEVDAVADAWQYIHCGENAFIRGTPLMRAVTRNRLKVVETLCEKGADPNFTTNGASAIITAALLHYPEILEILISKSTDEPRTVERSTGMSLLTRVIMGGSLEGSGSLFGRIRRHGHRWHSNARNTLQVLLDYGAGDHVHDVPGLSGLTALFLGATYAEPDILEFLLENGCAEHVNKFSTVPEDPHTSRSPLAATIKSRNMEAFRLLLKHGADATIRQSVAETEEPVTLLYECAWVANDDPEFAEALINHGVDVNESPSDYETPFGCAVRNRCFRLADCLLRNHADVNREYKAGLFFARERAMTVLGHLVAECSVGTLACLNFLFRSESLSSRPEFVVNRHLGLSVLHVVANTPFARQDDRASGMILDSLLTYFKPSQGQLDMTFSDQRYTALHIAVLHANYTVTRGLLTAGANLAMKDADGSTALDLGQLCVSDTAEIIDFDVSQRTRGKMRERRNAVAGLLADFSSPEMYL
jgi:ankyrin repeat protein